jgi:GTP-binding protein
LQGQNVGLTKPGESVRTGRIAELFVFDNLGRLAVEEATAGDIVMFSGLNDFQIGETVVEPQNPQPLTPIVVEEPTVKMTFGVNKSECAEKTARACTRPELMPCLGLCRSAGGAGGVAGDDAGDP